METPCQRSLKEYPSALGVRFKDAFRGNLKRGVSIDATQFIRAFIAVGMQIFTDELGILQILSGDTRLVRDDGVLGFAQSNRIDEPICTRLSRNGLYMLYAIVFKAMYLDYADVQEFLPKFVLNVQSLQKQIDTLIGKLMPGGNANE